MDVLNTLLGGQGCSTDGSATRNPITSLVDSVFNSHVVDNHHQQLGSFNDNEGYYMEEPALHQEMQSNFNRDFTSGATASPHATMGNQLPGMHNHMFGETQMWQQQQQFMMIQQQAQMSHMMQMQHHRAMMQDKYQNDSGNYEVEREMMRENYRTEDSINDRAREYVPEKQQAMSTASTEGLGKALEEALNEGELSSHRMDEIWSSFGAELTQNDPSYAATEAQDWTQERDRQQTSYIKNDGQSLDGYKKAWEDLSAKLEAGKDEYIYSTGNKYLANEENVKDDVDLFSEGMELFKAGKIREAILAFEAEVKKDGSNSEAWRMLGACHAENDEDKRAIVCLRRSVEEDPYNTDSLLALGTSYVNELDSVRALECLRTWVTHNPAFQGLEVEADEYSDGSKLDEVMQLMQAAATHSPGNCDAQVVLGVLYNISQDFENAIECFRRAIDLSPPDYGLLNKLGATLANHNKSEQAVQVYAKALNIRPTYARGWLNLGISFANMSLHEEAAKAYVQALHLTPSAKHIWGYLRVVFTSMNRLDLNEISSQENTTALAAELKIDLIHPS